MSYNIHPIFVHFPIAFLLLYSFIKIVPFYKWFPKISWKHIERVLLFAGVIGAFVASLTGETAEHLVRPDRNIVEMHSTFAGISTWVYAALLLGEILLLITPLLITKPNLAKLTKVLVAIQKVLINRVISILLAIVGLIAISVTGLLGGVMAFGLTADPVAPFVLKILGITP